MKLCFDSIEEVKTFVAGLKGTRGKKGEGDTDEGGQQPTGQAPAPLMPSQGQPQPFNPAPAPATFQPPAAFPGAPAADPVVAGLVQRIVARIDSLVNAGQPTDAVLGWLRNQCGAEASAATLDQIKTVFLGKLSAVGLEQIAKLIGA
jgi:hypothetical protein